MSIEMPPAELRALAGTLRGAAETAEEIPARLGATVAAAADSWLDLDRGLLASRGRMSAE
jgi:uncharacterized protein YukE